MVASAQAFDETKYPAWTGQWIRMDPIGQYNPAAPRNKPRRDRPSALDMSHSSTGDPRPETWFAAEHDPDGPQTGICWPAR